MRAIIGCVKKGGDIVARRRVNTTRLEIIQVAIEMFMKKGYSATSIKAVADVLDMSTGHLTFYFPTKEHLLAELVDILCNFQWAEVQKHVEEGETMVMAICLELTSMAAICEENDIVKDFYLSAYTHPMTLEIIRKNDAGRAKLAFEEYCPNWDDTRFAEAETLVSGIEYATIMTTGDSAPLDIRIAGALDNILTLYQVPQDIRSRKIEKVLGMDYKTIGRSVLKEFITFIKETTEQAFEELMAEKERKR
ncbi:MAG: TetR family transcriptional regulator [Ruminococcaceae bacterium]|nr:TetR family transcriptional regulator [Oscillospiraceae bacterium]